MPEQKKYSAIRRQLGPSMPPRRPQPAGPPPELQSRVDEDDAVKSPLRCSDRDPTEVANVLKKHWKKLGDVDYRSTMDGPTDGTAITKCEVMLRELRAGPIPSGDLIKLAAERELAILIADRPSWGLAGVDLTETRDRKAVQLRAMLRDIHQDMDNSKTRGAPTWAWAFLPPGHAVDASPWSFGFG